MDEEHVWDDLVADPWIRHAPVINGWSGPFGEAAIEALAPAPGESVLDVGCGLGPTTWALGARVGPEGSVTGVDTSEPFLRAARAGGTGENVRFVLGDAATVELPPVDAVFSRMGVMFFPDPTAAFRHLRSLARGGGRLAFACWQDAPSNPWMLVPVLASVPVLGPPQLPEPGAPGPFSLGDPDVIRAVLDGAGWRAVEVQGLAIDHAFPAGDARGCADVMIDVSPPLAAGVHDAPEKRGELVEAVTEALRPYERGGEVILPGAAWIVTARTG